MRQLITLALVLIAARPAMGFFGPRDPSRGSRSKDMLESETDQCAECGTEIPAGDLYCDECA